MTGCSRARARTAGRAEPGQLRTIFRYHRQLTGWRAVIRIALRHTFGIVPAEAGVDLAGDAGAARHAHVDTTARRPSRPDPKAEFDAARERIRNHHR